MQEQKLIWRQQAACRDADTNVFFPDSEAAADAAPALAICATCPVREACLEFALTTNQPDGIWGGATEAQRRRLRRSRRHAA